MSRASAGMMPSCTLETCAFPLRSSVKDCEGTTRSCFLGLVWVGAVSQPSEIPGLVVGSKSEA